MINNEVHMRKCVLILMLAVAALATSCKGQQGGQNSKVDTAGMSPAQAQLARYNYDSINYVLGYSTGMLYHERQVKLSEKEFLKGLHEGLDGKEALTQEQMQRIAGGYFQMMQAVEMEKAEAKAKVFFDSVQQLPNIQQDSTGLYYLITEQGQGQQPSEESYVQVHYTGYLTNGTVFDSSEGHDPVTFQLNRVIEGWKLGLQKMHEGGKAQLFIPAKLAYGPQGNQVIPPNSPLRFDVQLLKVMTEQEYQAQQKAQK